MQNEDSVKIIKRFFAVIDALVKKGEFRGRGSFCRIYGIHRSNFAKLENDMSRDIFQVAWLMYLVRDYGANPEYLITGRGKPFG